MRILHSHRWRRRLIITAVCIGVVVPLAYLGVRFSTPGASTEATGPRIPDSVFREEKPVPLTGPRRREIRRVLAGFLSTAVARQNVEDSWALAAPNLRQGISRREWNRGNLPVPPYPVSKHGLGSWDLVEYSYERTVMVEVLLFPRLGSGERPLAADVELKRDRKGRWRVDYFMPKKYHGVAAASPKRKAKTSGQHEASRTRKPVARAAPPDYGPHQRSRVWLLLPAALLALIVVTPLVAALAIWQRNRRAQAAFLRRS